LFGGEKAVLERAVVGKAAEWRDRVGLGTGPKFWRVTVGAPSGGPNLGTEAGSPRGVLQPYG
jgi:hypothetical protein